MAENQQVNAPETAKNNENTSQMVKPLEVIAREAQAKFTSAKNLIHNTQAMLDSGSNAETQINKTENSGNKDFTKSFKNEGIWNYGIDYLDSKNPTAKDKIWLALERADQFCRSPNELANQQSTTEIFNTLTAPSNKGEQVRSGDLVAAYDALTLRINNLNENNISSDQPTFQRKRDFLKKYLEKIEGVDLSENAIQSRLNSFSASSQRYHRNLIPSQSSDNFNRLARRASLLEVYGGEIGKSDLVKVQESLKMYPSDEMAFKRAMVQESLHGTPPSVNNMSQTFTKEEGIVSVPSKLAEEELADYKYSSLITLETNHAKVEVENLGVKKILMTILLGSAARKELRTKENDANDPSDIDLLMIVSDEDMYQLDQQMKIGKVRLSRSRTASGATFYLVKRPSVSGRLGDTEIMICSNEGFQKQLQGSEGDKTKFVNDAVNEGLHL